MLDKFDGGDLKYENTVLKLHPKKYPNIESLVQIFGNFVFP